MFFIFGFPRSGTTLLAQCLNAHSDVVVPGETDFIVPMVFVFSRQLPPEDGREVLVRLISRSCGAGSLLEYLDHTEIRDIVFSCDYQPAALITALYAALARSAGAKLAGDKSPNDLAYAGLIMQSGAVPATAKILHIVRDVRDVFVSLKNQSWGDKDVVSVACGWSRSNTSLHRRAVQDLDRYLLLRYEDLVREPEQELRRCCHLLGVEFQTAMLDCANRHPRYRGAAHHQRLYEPISAARVGVYNGHLTAQELGKCEEYASEGLKTFGYLSHDTSASQAEHAFPKLRAWFRHRVDRGRDAA